MTTEKTTFPVFLLDEGVIVDSYVAEWEWARGGTTVSMGGPMKFDITTKADQLIFETPVGCFTLPKLEMRPGDVLDLYPRERGAGSMAFEPCAGVTREMRTTVEVVE